MATNTENKVRYGLKNVHYAIGTENENGGYTYGTPVKWPGAVSLSLSPEGDDVTFHADDGVYFQTYANNGYSGSLETALIPEGFRTGVLGDKKDSKGVYLEDSDAVSVTFALLFEFTGDKKQIRHVVYGCTAGRPEVSGETKGDSIDVQTESLDITAGPVLFGDSYYVKAKTGADTDDTTYENWYKAVYLPTAAESGT